MRWVDGSERELFRSAARDRIGYDCAYTKSHGRGQAMNKSDKSLFSAKLEQKMVM
jgi:hypothetical protein